MESSFGRVVNSKLVVLISNWYKELLYKENMPNNFTTKFFAPLEFIGQWEVAISEMSYPLYLQNVDVKIDITVAEWPDEDEVKLEMEKLPANA